MNPVNSEDRIKQLNTQVMAAQEDMLDVFRHMIWDMATHQGINSQRIQEAFVSAMVSVKKKEEVCNYE